MIIKRVDVEEQLPEGRKYFFYRQNNSGGYLAGPALNVVIAAESEEESDAILSRQPGYTSSYCNCCGERWYASELVRAGVIGHLFGEWVKVTGREPTEEEAKHGGYANILKDEIDTKDQWILADGEHKWLHVVVPPAVEKVSVATFG